MIEIRWFIVMPVIRPFIRLAMEWSGSIRRRSFIARFVSIYGPIRRPSWRKRAMGRKKKGRMQPPRKL